MVKPLISDKGSKSNTNITLLDDSKIINDPSDVCCLLNGYFVNVTKDIGIQDAIIDSDTIDSILNDYKDHESVMYVKINLASRDNFHFKHVNPDDVYSVIHSVNADKATGYDMMSPRLVKISAHYLCYPLCRIINLCMDKGVFPDSMKHAEIVPVFKKCEKMEKSKLLAASDIMISWFENNNLQANPNKFQLIVFEEANEERSLAIRGADFQSSSSVKLLGVQIDQSLVFTEHISHLCIKAGRKINVISRLCHSLTTDAKLLFMQTFILVILIYLFCYMA